MAHSTRAADSRKARKPHKTSDTLTARGDGRWCKRYKANGMWCWWYGRGTELEALEEWRRVKADLLAGRVTRPVTDGLVIGELCNKFLTSKRTDLTAAMLSPRTFVEYSRTTDMLVDHFGRNRLVIDIRPEDFTELYGKMVKLHGITSLGREITMARSVFKYATANELIDKTINFGSKFKAPGKKDKRKAKAKQQHKFGKKLFAADEIKKLLAAAGPQLKAMLLLGINCGFGNTDCASLTLTSLDLAAGWVDFPRPKTGVPRRCPLWPETVKAIKAVIATRRQPKNPEYAQLVFLTRLGQPWVRYDLAETENEAGIVAVTAKSDDAIAKGTRKLLDELNIYRRGLSFYALRHTTETIGSGAADQVALDSLMGHLDDSMADEYREEVADSRLVKVADHLRRWLFSAKAKRKPATKKAARKPRQVKEERAALRIVG